MPPENYYPSDEHNIRYADAMQFLEDFFDTVGVINYDIIELNEEAEEEEIIEIGAGPRLVVNNGLSYIPEGL